MLRTAADLGANMGSREFFLKPGNGLCDIALALDPLFVQQLRNALVRVRLLEAERKILEFPLQLPDTSRFASGA
jgi:hypothetical protein